MKKITYIFFIVMLLASCANSEQQLRQRATELCSYIPDHKLLPESKEYLTEDFYAVLDTLFNMPEYEAMDHEWLHYFVTGNGGTIAQYEVSRIEFIDATHAVATLSVRQIWEDGSFAPESDIEEHQMQLERVRGKWLMSDFDNHKADCIRHIALNRKEGALREAISDYLVSEIGSRYLQGELCVPELMMIAETDSLVWGDFWIFWYNHDGDTLLTVSGGNHAGMMTISYENHQPRVTSFVETEDGAGNVASAQRIFGEHYDIYQNMHSNSSLREAIRQEQLSEYVRQHDLPFRYYKDYGWQAVALSAE